MIEFKPVRLEDRAVIERYTMPSVTRIFAHRCGSL